MAFAAKKAGTCASCAKPIEPGQFINWARRGPNKFKAWHQDCPTPSENSNHETETEPETTQVDPFTQVQTKPEPKAPSVHGDLATILANAIQPHIGSTESMKAEIMAMVEKRLNSVQTIEHVFSVTQRDGSTVKLEGRQHKHFDTLIKLLLNGDHVYLWGEPGSGKSTAAIKAAEALGFAHGYISLTPMTPESRLFGYMNGMSGEYVPTEFRRMYENGGVFCIDEMDNGSSALLVALNSALENGSCAFPDRMVAKHEDFILVATGNTVGLGANRMFPNRQPMDGAFRERFLFVNWETDTDLERHIALQFNPKAGSWIDWVQSVRKHAREHHPQLLVTQRASIKGAKLLANGFKPIDAAFMGVFKGFDADSVRSICAKFPIPSEVA